MPARDRKVQYGALHGWQEGSTGPPAPRMVVTGAWRKMPWVRGTGACLWPCRADRPRAQRCRRTHVGHVKQVRQ